MANYRAWLVGALAVLGLVVLVAFGSGHRDNYGRVRAAVGARAIQQAMTERPTPERRGRGMRRVIVSGEVAPGQ